MPVMDGITALKNLRKRGSNIPVLMLTAKTEIDDKVEGLDNGANDYLTKPFDTRELLARIRVMMRRKPQFTSNQLKIADLILDRDTRKVTRAGNEIDLSAKEFMVLECLMRNKNIVMTRQQIEQNAWDFDFEGGSNVIDVYISDQSEDVLGADVWQQYFTTRPDELTREEKHAYLAGITGVSLASDAFFPFGDNVERARKSGVSYIAEPGGSIRDDNVIETADKYGMVLCFTGMRLFHH